MDRRDNASNFAALTSLLANINRDSRKRPKPYTPQDFLGSEKKQMDDDEIYNALRAAFGPNVKRRKK